MTIKLTTPSPLDLTFKPILRQRLNTKGGGVLLTAWYFKAVSRKFHR